MKAERITAGERSKRSIYGVILLLIILAFVFVVPAFPIGAHPVLYNILLTGILVFAALSVDRARKRMFIIALSAIMVEWLAYILEMPAVMTISQTILFLYFILIVISLITQVATTRRVTARVIVESISGYLLMGIVFSLIIGIVARNNSSAYSFGGAVSGPEGLSDFVYYGFITFTTVGYGDIVPLTPVSKSIAVLSSVTGQIYLTVIIAMLVGKFLSGRQDG
jgi:voltage-gated potassium channel